MGLNDALSWYQCKIAAYDKQDWEETVEQRILNGLKHVPKKSAKLKLEYIDVDLVRGSSFSKAKSKHGFFALARLGLARLIFLPLYRQWWIKQTFPSLFPCFLVLYVTQLLNLLLYILWAPFVSNSGASSAVADLGNNSSQSGKGNGTSELGGTSEYFQVVTPEEVFLPILLMFILSIMLSQIVSTHGGNKATQTKMKTRRARRTKRRLLSGGRRVSIPGSDSKSSLEMASEDPWQSQTTLEDNISVLNGNIDSTLNVPASLKKRSSSEERPTSPHPVLLTQRSSSLHAESNPRVTCRVTNPAAQHSSPGHLRRSSIFGLRWPPRIVFHQAPAADDEGFDSFRGNNSSSSEAGDGTETQNRNGNKSESKCDLLDDQIEELVHDFVPPSPLQESSPAAEIDMSNSTLSCVTSNGNRIRQRNRVKESVKSNEEAVGIVAQAQDGASYERKPSTGRKTRFETGARFRTLLENDGHSPTWKEGFDLSSTAEAETEVLVSETEGSSIVQPSRRSTGILVNGRRPSDRHVGGRRRNTLQIRIPRPDESSYNSSCESDNEGTSPMTSPSYKSEASTPMDWTGVTTNSEECSYSSESQTESQACLTELHEDHPFAWECYGTPTISASSVYSDKVSCTMWEKGDIKKADLTVLDISSVIIAKVDMMPESIDYLLGGLAMSVFVTGLPLLYRSNAVLAPWIFSNTLSTWRGQLPGWGQAINGFATLLDAMLGNSFSEKWVSMSSMLGRCFLSSCFLFLLSVAERTFKQRFLYAKLFSHLTSSRRARKSDLPHFRLNKVRNIKTWLSVRSYLKKRGPQRSVDCIVSAAFVITLLLVTFLCMELLKESQSLHQSLYNVEILCWCMVLGVFLLRFMTLGSKINKKYRNLSVLITEQINLYLQMEQKPQKKEELMLANNVLKLAADLLKELESPFKISGLSANPYLYNLTKVVVLSAISGVLSEVLGFKLKLHKIKLR